MEAVETYYQLWDEKKKSRLIKCNVYENKFT
jgi:hypothetical protein